MPLMSTFPLPMSGSFMLRELLPVEIESTQLELSTSNS